MKNHTKIIVVILGAVISLNGCEHGPQTEDLPFGCNDQNQCHSEDTPEEEKQLPDNYIKPNALIPLPVYDLPNGWVTNPAASGYSLRSTDLNEDSCFLTINLQDQEKSLPQLLDQRYQQVYCEGPQNPFTNCQAGFQTGSGTISGKEVLTLSYRGTWRDREDPVNEYFFRIDERNVSIQTEGGCKTLPQALEQIVKTLTFEMGKYNPQPNYDDWGGL